MYLTKYRPLIVALTLVAGSATPTAIAAPFDTIETLQTVPLSSFEKVYIAPVRVELEDTKVRRNIRDTRSDRAVSDVDKERKARDSHKDIVNAFSKKFEIADAPGPDILTVETIVTRLSSTRPTLEDFNLNVSLSFKSVYIGKADFKVLLRQDDTVLAEIKDSASGNFNDGFPRISTWQDYDRLSDRFARKLAKYVARN